MESLAPLLRRTEVVATIQDDIVLSSMATYEQNLLLLNSRIAALLPLIGTGACVVPRRAGLPTDPTSAVPRSSVFPCVMHPADSGSPEQTDADKENEGALRQ